jgi:hypothetical protein
VPGNLQFACRGLFLLKRRIQKIYSAGLSEIRSEFLFDKKDSHPSNSSNRVLFPHEDEIHPNGMWVALFIWKKQEEKKWLDPLINLKNSNFLD